MDGIDDYIAIDNFFYTGTGHTEVTVEAWVKIPAGGDNNIIASYDRSDFWRLEIGGDISPVGYIGWAVMTDAGVIDCVSNTPVDDGQWHHIAGVYDNGFVGVYIDGQLDNSTTFGTTFGNTTTRYGYIGVGSEATSYNNGIGPALYFGGEIDEVRIWDVARSQTELQSNKDIFLTGAETGLTAYYPMDEGNGNSTTTDLANGLSLIHI